MTEIYIFSSYSKSTHYYLTQFITSVLLHNSLPRAFIPFETRMYEKKLLIQYGKFYHINPKSWTKRQQYAFKLIF